MPIPTVVSAIRLPEGFAPSDIAGAARDGFLGISAEGTAALVMPVRDARLPQEVRNLSSPSRFPSAYFAPGVRILAVFGEGSDIRIRLWGKPRGESRTGIWKWTRQGLQFQEQLDELSQIRSCPYEGAMPVGRNPQDPVGYARYLVPGHLLMVRDQATIQICADGSLVQVDAQARSASRLEAFSGQYVSVPLRFPPASGHVQYMRWGREHFFFLRRESGIPGLWSASYGFLEIGGGPGWQLEYAWGAPEGSRLALLFRRSSPAKNRLPVRRIVVTGGEPGPTCPVALLAEGQFRLPSQPFSALTWSRKGGHAAVCLQRSFGRDPARTYRDMYASSLVTLDHPPLLLPQGTESATCVVNDRGEVVGALARRSDASSTMLFPGSEPCVAKDAWGLHTSRDGELAWNALYEDGRQLTLARLTTAFPRPVFGGTDAIA